MARYFFIFLLALASFPAAAQEGSGGVRRLTLQECLSIVATGNYNRQSVALNETANRDLYDQSKRDRRPNLTASVGESFSHTTGEAGTVGGNYSVNAGVTLWQGGSVNATIEKSRLAAEQAALRTGQYDNELAIQVLESFLTALGNEELLRYQQSIATASEEQLRQGKARYGSGDILESDYLLLEAQHASDLDNIFETRINRDNSLNVLKGLMSMDMATDIEIVYPDDSALERMGVMPSEEDVLARSMESLPDVRISDYNVEIAETGVRISRAAYAPTISANAGIGTGHSQFSNFGSQLSDRFNQQVGISVSIPLFNRGRTKSNVTQSRIALRQAELERSQTALDIEQTVTQQYRSVVAAESKYRSSEIRSNAYSASFDTYRLKFEQGAITAVEMLQQQNNYISAMNDYIRNKYGFMLRRKVLDVYMGEEITM
ncbi:MAG: TolC family protein [Alistipes sp.]|jgi:outer membrane protein|nr:TolC family protein [Alistipes sp.]